MYFFFFWCVPCVFPAWSVVFWNRFILGTVFSKLLVDCAGHYGHIKLELPVFHIGYFKHTLTTLQVRMYGHMSLRSFGCLRWVHAFVKISFF